MFLYIYPRLSSPPLFPPLLSYPAFSSLISSFFFLFPFLCPLLLSLPLTPHFIWLRPYPPIPPILLSSLSFPFSYLLIIHILLSSFPPYHPYPPFLPILQSAYSPYPPFLPILLSSSPLYPPSLHLISPLHSLYYKQKKENRGSPVFFLLLVSLSLVFSSCFFLHSLYMSFLVFMLPSHLLHPSFLLFCTVLTLTSLPFPSLLPSFPLCLYSYLFPPPSSPLISTLLFFLPYTTSSPPLIFCSSFMFFAIIRIDWPLNSIQFSFFV